jgi:Holliday junction DNA helicase RuvA
MIAYINGKITFKSPAYIYMDIQGLGYHVNITLQTYSKIEQLNEVKLFTHLHIKEDSHTIYGFFEEDEKELFVQLLSVSGIGPNTARIILSSMTSEQVRSAILHENVQLFSKVKGIGPKTAKRIILDLKDKIIKGGKEIVLTDMVSNNTNYDAALQALVALGFQKSQAEKALNKVNSEHPEANLEEFVKLALKQLS